MIFKIIWIFIFFVNFCGSYIYPNMVVWRQPDDIEIFTLRQDPVGLENSNRILYLCRIRQDNGEIAGKLVGVLQSFVCKVPYEGGEISSGNFEVLEAYPGVLTWKPWNEGNGTYDGFVLAGVTENEKCYVCRANVRRDLLPGRLSPRSQACIMSKDGVQYERRRNVEVLVKSSFGYAMNTPLP